MPAEASPSESRRVQQENESSGKPQTLEKNSPLSHATPPHDDFEVDREGYSPYSRDPAHMRVPVPLPPPQTEGRFKDDQSPHSAKHKHGRGCLMRGDDLSPRNAASEGPWVGHAPPQEEHHCDHAHHHVPAKRADSNASHSKLPAKSTTREWAADAVLSPRSQQPHWTNARDEYDIDVYSSPRNAKTQPREEMLEPESLNPYKQHDNYISHPQDHANCYSAAIENSKSKYDVFYKDVSPLGDLRQKEPNPLSEDPVEEIVSPRHMQWDDSDHFVEHFYKYKSKKDQAEVCADYDLRRDKTNTISNTQLPAEAYKKKKNRKVMKDLEVHGYHKAGHGLDGHSDDSCGEASPWARGVEEEKEDDYYY